MNALHSTAEIEPGLVLDCRGALLLVEHRTLLVADIHWGYSLEQRARRALFPMHGDEDIARRLDSLVAEHHPERMVWLGDSLHGPTGRAPAETWLARQPADRCTILAGNHDRGWNRVQTHELRMGNWLLHHGDRPVAVPSGMREIIGHLHPCLNYQDGAGTRLRLPALVASPQRIILPAFSPWAAGESWNNRLGPADRMWVLARNGVFEVPPPARSPGA